MLPPPTVLIPPLTRVAIYHTGDNHPCSSHSPLRSLSVMSRPYPRLNRTSLLAIAAQVIPGAVVVYDRRS